jgi:hypothetical protein
MQFETWYRLADRVGEAMVRMSAWTAPLSGQEFRSFSRIRKAVGPRAQFANSGLFCS